MKVGILTLPLHNNYGGMIQAAALYRVLETLGHEPTLISKKFWRPLHHRTLGPILRAIPGHDLKKIHTQERIRARHTPFLNRFIARRSPELYTSSSIERWVKAHGLHAVIVGSDQVWRPSYLSDRDTVDYFLGFGGKFNRIAYAASFGKSEWTAPDRLPLVRDLLAAFDSVSLREVSGLALCRDVLGRENCETAVDPTILVDPTFYDDAMAPKTPAPPYMLNYVLDPSPIIQSIAQKALAQTGTSHDVRTIGLEDGPDTVDIPQWLRAFQDADFIVTDSFHGTVFSILFQKQFVCVGNEERGLDRFVSLLSQLGLEDRLVLKDNWTPKRHSVIDYVPVNRRLEELRKGSLEFLKTALA